MTKNNHDLSVEYTNSLYNQTGSFTKGEVETAFVCGRLSLYTEIELLKSELRGYDAIMADRHRLLEENWELREKLRCL